MRFKLGASDCIYDFSVKVSKNKIVVLVTFLRGYCIYLFICTGSGKLSSARTKLWLKMQAQKSPAWSVWAAA